MLQIRKRGNDPDVTVCVCLQVRCILLDTVEYDEVFVRGVLKKKIMCGCARVPRKKMNGNSKIKIVPLFLDLPLPRSQVSTTTKCKMLMVMMEN